MNNRLIKKIIAHPQSKAVPPIRQPKTSPPVDAQSPQITCILNFIETLLGQFSCEIQAIPMNTGRNILGKQGITPQLARIKQQLNGWLSDQTRNEICNTLQAVLATPAIQAWAEKEHANLTKDQKKWWHDMTHDMSVVIDKDIGELTRVISEMQVVFMKSPPSDFEFLCGVYPEFKQTLSVLNQHKKAHETVSNTDQLIQVYGLQLVKRRNEIRRELVQDAPGNRFHEASPQTNRTALMIQKVKGVLVELNDPLVVTTKVVMMAEVVSKLRRYTHILGHDNPGVSALKLFSEKRVLTREMMTAALSNAATDQQRILNAFEHRPRRWRALALDLIMAHPTGVLFDMAAMMLEKDPQTTRLKDPNYRAAYTLAKFMMCLIMECVEPRFSMGCPVSAVTMTYVADEIPRLLRTERFYILRPDQNQWYGKVLGRRRHTDSATILGPDNVGLGNRDTEKAYGELCETMRYFNTEKWAPFMTDNLLSITFLVMLQWVCLGGMSVRTFVDYMTLTVLQRLVLRPGIGAALEKTSKALGLNPKSSGIMMANYAMATTASLFAQIALTQTGVLSFGEQIESTLMPAYNTATDWADACALYNQRGWGPGIKAIHRQLSLALHPDKTMGVVNGAVNGTILPEEIVRILNPQAVIRIYQKNKLFSDDELRDTVGPILLGNMPKATLTAEGIRHILNRMSMPFLGGYQMLSTLFKTTIRYCPASKWSVLPIILTKPMAVIGQPMSES